MTAPLFTEQRLAVKSPYLDRIVTAQRQGHSQLYMTQNEIRETAWEIGELRLRLKECETALWLYDRQHCSGYFGKYPEAEAINGSAT